MQLQERVSPEKSAEEQQTEEKMRSNNSLFMTLSFEGICYTEYKLKYYCFVKKFIEAFIHRTVVFNPVERNLLARSG